MPEPYFHKRGPGQLLSVADRTGEYLRARCHICRTTKLYLPADIMKITGDVGIYQLEAMSHCTKCGDPELDLEFWKPAGAQMASLKIRRLVSIKWVRKLEWRDEGG